MGLQVRMAELTAAHDAFKDAFSTRSSIASTQTEESRAAPVLSAAPGLGHAAHHAFDVAYLR
jgi:hypothetical protein